MDRRKDPLWFARWVVDNPGLYTPTTVAAARNELAASAAAKQPDSPAQECTECPERP